MATAREYPETGSILFTATTTAKSSGDVCLMTDMIGIALVDIAAAGTGAVATTGVWTMTKQTNAAYAQGDSVYYSAATAKLSLAGTSNYYCGKVWTAATTAATTVKIALNFLQAGPR